MHQPYYKNLVTNRFEMPWVRLHSMKGYYDIPSIIEKYENIKLTVNIVPSLLEQIVDYSNKNGDDFYLYLSTSNSKELSDEEKLFIIDNFFSVNHKIHLKQGGRYKELFEKRSNTKDKEILKKRMSLFSDKDIIDLQMHFNLSWFGFTAKEKYPIIDELIIKDRDFTKNEIINVIKIQEKIISELVPLYKKLQHEGKLEISVSPYYHPILPLIYDTDTAVRCMPESLLPPKFSYKSDAMYHIEKAISYFEEIFGEKPKGMWPSEGSVSPEILEMVKKNGINWVATDEEILKNSGYKNIHRYDYIYKPYDFITGSGKLKCIFRDKNLSDMIGFRCHQVSTDEGVRMVLDELSSINNYHKNNKENITIPIVLDGENPWEYYKNSGKDFLTLLFSKLDKDKKISIETISETLKKEKNIKELTYIHSGSWINANFKIWIGHKETNKAWTYLLRTREFYENEIKNKYEKIILEKAFKELMIAEGSDWFWWFGDDFTISDKDKFDSLFRQHLANVYKLSDHPVPSFLSQPISSSSLIEKNITLPKTIININLTGKNHSFFDWLGAGVYTNSSKGSAMYEGESIISNIKFGYNEKYLFLKVNSTQSLLYHHLKINIQDSIEYTMETKIERKKENIYLKKSNGENSIKTEIECIYCYEQVLEVAIPYTDFDFKKGENLQFSVEIETPEKRKFRIPAYGLIDTEFKGKSPLTSYWTT